MGKVLEKSPDFSLKLAAGQTLVHKLAGKTETRTNTCGLFPAVSSWPTPQMAKIDRRCPKTSATFAGSATGLSSLELPKAPFAGPQTPKMARVPLISLVRTLSCPKDPFIKG